MLDAYSIMYSVILPIVINPILSNVRQWSQFTIIDIKWEITSLKAGLVSVREKFVVGDNWCLQC